VMVEVAIALHEAEASRVHIGKCRSDGAWWIVERPPNTLAGAGPHCQPVRVMHLGAPVDPLGLLLLGVPVHRGQRRNAQPLNVAAQMDLLLDVHCHSLIAAHPEAKSSRDAWPL